jgi:hypothetical protein
MTVLYQKIKIPNFEIIMTELLRLVAPQISQNLRYWDIPLIDFEKFTPMFYGYILKNFYNFPKLFRFYNTPPFGNLHTHIDSLPTSKQRIGFNIPLAGTTNTFMNYYNTPSDNLFQPPFRGFGSTGQVMLVKDKTKLELIDSFELNQPALIRTDVVHSVINPNKSYRLVLGMKLMGTTFEEVYKGKLESV